MKTYKKELWLKVPTRRAFINITPDIQDCIDESGIIEGFVLVGEALSIPWMQGD